MVRLSLYTVFKRRNCFAHYFLPKSSKDFVKCDCVHKCKYGPPPYLDMFKSTRELEKNIF